MLQSVVANHPFQFGTFALHSLEPSQSIFAYGDDHFWEFAPKHQWLIPNIRRFVDRFNPEKALGLPSIPSTQNAHAFLAQNPLQLQNQQFSQGGFARAANGEVAQNDRGQRSLLGSQHLLVIQKVTQSQHESVKDTPWPKESIANHVLKLRVIPEYNYL